MDKPLLQLAETRHLIKQEQKVNRREANMLKPTDRRTGHCHR